VPRTLVASDLDGTLLDERSYSFAAARPALATLAERGVPLVLVSSKTRAEMDPLARELAPETLLIVENGGAVLLPQGAPRVLGVPRAELVAALDALVRETGVALRGFAEMPAAEVAERTGLSLEAAALALAREYDEPFVLEPTVTAEASQRLAEAAARRGLRVTRGGRFHHLTGATDKGRALRLLLAELAQHGRCFERVIGLGDAANDRPLLEAVDVPVIVPRADGAPDAALVEALPRARIAPFPGPRGWNAVVLALLEEPMATASRAAGGAA